MGKSEIPNAIAPNDFKDVVCMAQFRLFIHSLTQTECEKRCFKCTFANWFDVECKIEFHQLVSSSSHYKRTQEKKNHIHDPWHSTMMKVHKEKKNDANNGSQGKSIFSNTDLLDGSLIKWMMSVELDA